MTAARRTFTDCDSAAFDALFTALEDARTRGEDYPDDYPEFETYFSDTEDCIDGNGSEVVNALLAAGWTPPRAAPEESR